MEALKMWTFGAYLMFAEKERGSIDRKPDL
jgi:hypothetical protein